MNFWEPNLGQNLSLSLSLLVFISLYSREVVKSKILPDMWEIKRTNNLLLSLLSAYWRIKCSFSLAKQCANISKLFQIIVFVCVKMVTDDSFWVIMFKVFLPYLWEISVHLFSCSVLTQVIAHILRKIPCGFGTSLLLSKRPFVAPCWSCKAATGHS